MDIYRLPKILIFHFKRFKISDTIKKNLSKIVYPIKGLDMSNYVP